MNDGSNGSIKPVVLAILISLLLGTFIGFGLVSFFFIGPHEVKTTEFTPVSYTDFVTILLSVVTVLLAILGIILAVLAVFGYTVLKNAATASAKNTAAETAKSVVSDSFEEDGEIRALILSKLTRGSPLMNGIEERISREFYVSISDGAVDLNEGLEEDGAVEDE